MSEWISVKDRLPEPNSRVLTCYNVLEPTFKKYRSIVSKGHIGIKMYVKYNGFCSLWDNSDYHEVTHWMELPEPPKDDI